jgi:hypothetical protein
MNWRSLLLLALLGSTVSFAVAQFQAFPGYLDADYYFAGGLQLARGKGFTEPYLWNYLDDPIGIPHPSHTYWMPLASIIAAGGMWLTGEQTLSAARLGFILLAGLVPAVTAVLAFSFSKRRELAVVSGLLGAFSIYYAPFLSVPDNYGIYLVLGGVFLIVLGWRKDPAYLVLGILAGVLTLARSDGVLWLGLTWGIIGWRQCKRARGADEATLRETKTRQHRVSSLSQAGLQVMLSCVGFLLVTGAWLSRTYSIFGTPLAPGGGHLLWLKTYEETFAYPASQITFHAWLSQGWEPIIGARLAALKWNLLNAFAAQGSVYLAPFILIGLWVNRRDERVQVGVVGWLALLLVMTAIFPFAGARGGFFHSGAALQSLWWTAGPAGLAATVAAARERRMFTTQASAVFQAALVGLAVLMTVAIFVLRVLPGWGEGEQEYPKLEEFLQESGARAEDVVMVRNPPGYFLMSGRPAIVVPYADASAMLAAAIRYRARYVLIESVGAAGPIKSVYDDTHSQHFQFLGELDGTRVFRVQP